MSEEVLINVTPQETRVAVVENGVLQEIIIERTKKRGLVSNIYKGKVTRVLPGMAAAFVDIGLERAAFLHVSDIVSSASPANSLDDGSICITDLLKEGQPLLVQVIKDPMGSKGARLTTQISIPSRYLVVIPDLSTIGISQRIAGDERQRLLDIVRRHIVANLPPEAADQPAQRVPCGFIIRTAADGMTGTSLETDMDFLCRVWDSTLEQAAIAEPCSLIYEDFPLVIRTIRDLAGSGMEKIRIDSKETYEYVQNFAEQYVPELAPIIEHYTGERLIFELHAIEEEIGKALERNVMLKSGGYLVIDQTEAMTTIDVNTGKFVGHRNLEETIFKTNLEATNAIARQLRLRNLGGIIILDFIDMADIDHRRQVIRSLEKWLERDHAKTHISEISSLGLVQMTRKRTRESLEHVLCITCPTCSGRGSVKSVETVCYEILREILRESRQFEPQQFLIFAAQEVADLLIDEESESLAQLEKLIQREIKVQVELFYSQEQYDIVLV
ncbi:MAG: ribonuclease G [Gammaproteobacteria bacterium]|nr:ribonuclease G [Gammaproteobacteria bacterium]